MGTKKIWMEHASYRGGPDVAATHTAITIDAIIEELEWMADHMNNMEADEIMAYINKQIQELHRQKRVVANEEEESIDKWKEEYINGK